MIFKCDNALSNEHSRKEWLIKCLLVTSVWMLVAHAYVMFQDSFSHDSLNAFFADSVENAWKIQLGRMFKPLYQMLTRGDIALPWMIGVLSILWIGFSVYFVTRIFSVDSILTLILIGGVFTTNITVSSTAATYIYDLDANMFALFLATLAVHVWRSKHNIWWTLLGMLLVCTSMGMYQSYVSVAIVLMMLACMLDFINGKEICATVKTGFKAIVMLIGGAIMYVVALMICKAITGIDYESGTYNSVVSFTRTDISVIVRRALYAYKIVVTNILQGTELPYSSWFAWCVHGVFICAVAYRMMTLFIEKKKSVVWLLWTFLLAFLLPVAMQFAGILGGMFHHVMMFSMWLVYLFGLLIFQNGEASADCLGYRCCRYIVYALVAIILLGNIRTSNTLYLEKDMEESATLSLMTRVVARMEENDEYIHGETPVAIYGVSDTLEQAPAFSRYSSITGMDDKGSVITNDRSISFYYYPYEKYVRNILGMTTVMCDDAEYTELSTSNEVNNMPSYPDEGCMKLVDGVFVIKMGDIE